MKTGTEKPFVIPVFIPHRGCFHRCIFCNQNAVTSASSALPGQDEISATVQQYLSYRRSVRGFTELSFYGGNFLGLSLKEIHRLLKIASGFVSSGKIDGIRFSTRPDTIDEKHLEIIKNYPVTTVELGIQSMDEKVLKAIKRGHTASQSRHAAELLKKTHVRLGCQIMTGLPEENEDSAIKSARDVASLGPDFVRIYPLVVLAESRLAVLYKEKKFIPMDIKNCVERVKKLYKIFAEQNINVIRMGLQASQGLDKPGTILAGPYHPSFGHMVLSSIMLDRARAAIDALSGIPEAVVFRVHPTDTSRLEGLCKTNIKTLKNEYPGIKQIYINPDPEKEKNDLTLEALL